MIKTSLRHASRSCPSCQCLSPRPSIPASIAAPFSSRSHQRRQSSSKPPIPPNDGTPSISPASVKTVGAPRTKEPNDKRASADARASRRKISREKAEMKPDVRDEWTASLPSVPSTQHLDPKDVYVASFFSIHRPMSVTSSVPASAPEKTIESIFAQKKLPSRQKSGPAEVIYTLTSAVQNLDNNISSHQQQQSAMERPDIIQALTQNKQPSNNSDPNQIQHLDGQPQPLRVPNGVKLVIQEVARRFRPFNVPPVPVPVSDSELEAREAEAAAAEAGEAAQARELEAQIESQDQESPRQVILTVHEAGDMQARRFFTAHNAPMLRIQDGHVQIEPLRRNLETREPSRPSSSRRLQRPGSYSDPRDREMARRKLFALSVKRQRKLKMKKHKYKKLMRKTRNLRRRMDKL